MKVCQYSLDNYRITCERIVPDPFLKPNTFSHFIELTRDEGEQKLAMKTLVDGGILIAMIGKKSDYFKVLLLVANSNEVRVLKKKFSGCDASVEDSNVTPVIVEQIAGFKYCITEICESARIFNIQVSQFKDSYCFTLNSFDQ